MDNNLVIIKVDGGIVSQLNFFAIGQLFKTKGYKVKYDISWFEKHGKGFYNVSKNYDKDYDINWDIPKIFPDEEIEIATKEEIKYYKKYKTNDESALSYKPPLYIDGYNLKCDITEICTKLRKNFNPLKIYTNEIFLALAEEIQKVQSCGVHIRRGDLSDFHTVYGEPNSICYFLKSIELVSSLQKDISLYFFSDDKKWVEQNLIPLLKNKRYILCDVSSPENPYLDLYLLSKCKFIIGSHGSMGLGAKLLAEDNVLFITPLISRFIPLFKFFGNINNIMILNWDSQKLNLNKTGGYTNSKIKFKYKLMLKIYHYIRQKLLSKFLVE